MSNKETSFLIINQAANGNFGLAVRGTKVVLAPSDSRDIYQQWIKKETSIKDRDGQLAFVLVNKGSNEAIKPDTPIAPMNLVPYDSVASPNDTSILWTESVSVDQGFRYIRWVSNIEYHMTAESHEVQDGRIVNLTTGTHISERWKFSAYNANDQQVISKTVAISCRSKEGFNLTIRNDTVMLALADPTKDKHQVWVKEISYAKQIKDQDGKPAFALVNKATGKAIKHGFGAGSQVLLAPFNRNYLDPSLLWTESEKETGFQEIRMQSNTSAVFHAFYVNKQDSDKALLFLQGSKNGSNDQRWKYQEITEPGDAGNSDFIIDI
ncbi:hypothetical protein LUZ61_000806 [Rhynchospora tenuis]|uniref:Uncharacterized protein n=1 Tax=Rhynchospora tenuis TaxID=198213 RepID=A0AAD5ZG22_9POAL|nr:hypothetical protein LUZ61_000806 [Rhynchospora tenuis]